MGQTASASKVYEVMFCRSMSVSRLHPMDKSSAADREKSWSIGPIDYWPWFSIEYTWWGCRPAAKHMQALSGSSASSALRAAAANVDLFMTRGGQRPKAPSSGRIYATGLTDNSKT